MFPDSWQVGPLSLHPYGFMLALGFLSALLLARWKAPGRGLSAVAVVDIFQIILVSSIVGSRAFFVITHWDLYAQRPWESLYIWEGGMTLYGGLLLPFLAVAVYTWRKGIAWLDVADVASLGIAAGLFFGRIGCFLRGCCYGRPTDLPLGIAFPERSEASRQARLLLAEKAGSLAELPASPHVHPTQLYAAGAALIILALLLLLWKRLNHRGMALSIFMILYGLDRSLVDLFRYYDASGRGFGGLLLSQWISLGFSLAGLALLLHLLRHRRSRS